MFDSLMQKPRVSHDIRLIRVAGDPREECCMCGTPTETWAEAKDVPLCMSCAETSNVFSIPTKRQWLVSLGVNLDPNWRPYST